MELNPIFIYKISDEDDVDNEKKFKQIHKTEQKKI